MDEGFNVESEGSGEETELREDEEEDEEQAKQKASDQECEEEEQAKQNTESANTEEEDDDEGEWSKMAKKIWICFNCLVLGSKNSYIHTQIGYTLCNWSDCYTFLEVTTWFGEQISFKGTALNN